MQQEVLDQVDRERIVEMACNLANIVSITGDEENVAKYLGSEFETLGMKVEYQYVEDGRPNVIGTLKGTGGGATLMFNAHMDHFDAPQETVVDEDRIYGRGLVNMKAAFPCYIEAVSALAKSRRETQGRFNYLRRRRRNRKSANRPFPRQRVSRRRRRRALLDGPWRDGRYVHHRRAHRLATANRQLRSALGAGERRRQGDEIRSRRLQSRPSDSRLGERIPAQKSPQVHAAHRANRRHRRRQCIQAWDPSDDRHFRHRQDAAGCRAVGDQARHRSGL